MQEWLESRGSGRETDDVIHLIAHFSRSSLHVPYSTHTPTPSPLHLPSVIRRGFLQLPSVFFPPSTFASSESGVSSLLRHHSQEARGAPHTGPWPTESTRPRLLFRIQVTVNVVFSSGSVNQLPNSSLVCRSKAQSASHRVGATSKPRSSSSPT
jgi:hypothetical protein